MILLSFISIFGLTGLVWLLNKVLPIRICPICAGVSGTWLWMLLAHAFGFAVDLMVPAILMGGSVVGIAYTSEKHLGREEHALLWKTLFIPAGFVAAFGAVKSNWLLFGAGIATAILLAIFFLRPRKKDAANSGIRVRALEKQMEKCC